MISGDWYNTDWNCPNCGKILTKESPFCGCKWSKATKEEKFHVVGEDECPIKGKK